MGVMQNVGGSRASDFWDFAELTMGYGEEYRPVDRDQGFLLPPDMHEWLAPGDLVWFVISVVEQLDLGEFEKRSRRGGASFADAQRRVLASIFGWAWLTGLAEAAPWAT